MFDYYQEVPQVPDVLVGCRSMKVAEELQALLPSNFTTVYPAMEPLAKTYDLGVLMFDPQSKNELEWYWHIFMTALKPNAKVIEPSIR